MTSGCSPMATGPPSTPCSSRSRSCFRSCWTTSLIGEVTGVLIWAIAGMGLMLLTGHAGQVSIGHAAFLAVGCYANVILMDRFGLPFVTSFLLAGNRCRDRRGADRDSGVPAARHLPRHRNPRPLHAGRGHHRPGRTVDGRSGRPDRANRHHCRHGHGPVQLAGPVLLAVPCRRAPGHTRVSQHPASTAGKGLSRDPRLRGVRPGDGRPISPGRRRPPSGCRASSRAGPARCWGISSTRSTTKSSLW